MATHIGNSCSIGNSLGDACHLLTYSRTTGLKTIESLSKNVRELIFWKSELSILNVNANICYHHEYMLTTRFQMNFTRCSDPFKKHRKPVKGL